MKPTRRHTLLGAFALPFAQFLGRTPVLPQFCPSSAPVLPPGILDLLERAVAEHEELFGHRPDVLVVSPEQVCEYLTALGASAPADWFLTLDFRGIPLKAVTTWKHDPWGGDWPRLNGVPIPPNQGRLLDCLTGTSPPGVPGPRFVVPMLLNP